MVRRLPQFWPAIGAIFTTALVLRLLIFAYVAHEPRKFYTYDSDGYDRRAMNVLRYGVFASQTQPPFAPDLERTPVYPALLAAIFAVAGHVPGAAIAVQLVLGSVTALLAFALARELQLPSRAGLLAALLVALDPLSALMANRLLTETLFTLLLIAGLCSLARYWRSQSRRTLVAAALLLALAALTRPISQFLALALLPLFGLAAHHNRTAAFASAEARQPSLLARAWLRKALAAAALFAAISMALTYTWAYRNYRAAGVFTLSTIGDINLIYYRGRAVLAAAEGISQEAAWRQIQAQIDRETARQRLGPAGKLALERATALDIFWRYPRLTAAMTIKGAGRLLLDPGYTLSCTLLDRSSTAFDCFPGESTMDNPGIIHKVVRRFWGMTIVQQLALVWGVLLQGLIWIGTAAGAIRLARERRWLPLALLGVTIGYFIALSSGAEADSRFRTPIVPYFAILAGLGVDALAVSFAARLRWLRSSHAVTTAVAGDVSGG